MTDDKNSSWIYCENCGKKLIKRKPNGVFIFRFGRTKNSEEPLVDLEIFGSIRLKCFREKCRHLNIMNLFPS